MEGYQVVWLYAILVILIALLSIYEIIKSIRDYKAAPQKGKKFAIFVKLVIFIAAVLVLYAILSGTIVREVITPTPE